MGPKHEYKREILNWAATHYLIALLGLTIYLARPLPSSEDIITYKIWMFTRTEVLNFDGGIATWMNSERTMLAKTI